MEFFLQLIFKNYLVNNKNRLIACYIIVAQDFLKISGNFWTTMLCSLKIHIV